MRISTDYQRPLMKTIQKLEIITDQQGGYQNFFMYGHETMRLLRQGWYIKHIHDDPGRQIAWVLYEQILRAE